MNLYLQTLMDLFNFKNHFICIKNGFKSFYKRFMDDLFDYFYN